MSIKERLKQAKEKQQIYGDKMNCEKRYQPEITHMVICDVHRNEPAFQDIPVTRMRTFLNDKGYKKALEMEEQGTLRIIQHYRVSNGVLTYQPRKQPQKTKHKQLEMTM